MNGWSCMNGCLACTTCQALRRGGPYATVRSLVHVTGLSGPLVRPVIDYNREGYKQNANLRSLVHVTGLSGPLVRPAIDYNREGYKQNANLNDNNTAVK